MGELLNTFGRVDINGESFDIELNAPVNEATGGIIHIQNKKLRLEMTQLDFYEIVTSLNLAKANLIKIKRNSDL